MATIVLTVEIQFDPRDRDRMMELLRPMEAASRAEPGCLRYQVYEAMFEPGRVLVHQHWASEEALAEHTRQPHLRAFQAASEGLRLGAITRTLHRIIDEKVVI
ncbi:quinol monooxygenase YgiN [Tepidamorphus gemmatus]|jgi:quinol monooxygenase YgiN|uniref:Quinol monooxygenase YgiN n=1 Tax=Tepidamorphus gemmatus TaxID=747076 RepID=A0A4R3MIG9_9HYPH|nr:putative quinol monooxygenase [Tepidamorphus gemmatus]TCT13671.1 quinol monooxygenase YgiN [Tepidamorphus gemmatus]